MKKFLFIFISMFIVLSCSAGEFYHSYLFKSTSYYYDKDANSVINDFMPYKVKGDSVMIISTKDKEGGYPHPRLYSKGTSTYIFDIIVSKKLANLVGDMVEEYDGDDLSGLVVYCYTVGFYESLKEASKEFPFGYVRSWDWSVNSIGGICPMFSYMNTNKKTIKYITFYISFYNPVGDICKNTLNGSTVAVCKCIGPITYGEYATFSWEDDPVFYNKVANEMRIKKILIQYTDNTKITLIKDIKYEGY